MSNDAWGAEAVRRAARWLPHQGPLEVFVHHNTLSELENRPFSEALEEARAVLGARVRLSEPELRRMLADGHIAARDLDDVFDETFRAPEEPDPVGLPAWRPLARGLLWHGLDDVHWRVRAFRVAEGQPDPVVAGLPPDARAVLVEGARRVFAADLPLAIELLTGTAEPERQRSRLREQHALSDATEALATCASDERRAAELGLGLLTGLARRHLPPRVPRPPIDRTSVVDAVDEVLLPVVAAVLDLGQARVRPRGELFDLGLAAARRSSLWRSMAPLVGPDAERTVVLALDAATPEDREDAVLRVLLQRPGWAGAVARREHDRHDVSLLDYAALRLALTVAACRTEELDPASVLARPEAPGPGRGTRAGRVAQLLALHHVGPDAALRLPEASWAAAEQALERYDTHWRARILQEARERTHRRTWLTALSTAPAAKVEGRPRLDALCCIDDREESFRRALEEVAGPAVRTFGVAGHFGLNVRFRGATDVRPAARHPVALRSTHRLEERALGAPGRLRPLAGGLSTGVERGGIGPIGGWVASLVAGWPALGALAARVVAPGWTDAASRRWSARLLPPPPSELVVMRVDDRGDLPLGFDADEAAERVGGLLHTIGLGADAAPVVLVLGHRSTSRNNPFASAYECGACGGTPGGENARAFARMANDPEVRARLAASGLELPADTVFVGGVHDTATDEVFTDAPLPDELGAWLARAADRDADERARRFLSEPEGGAFDASGARGRGADPSEVRPEYCHATNAVFVVGPRTATRHLFLDRRALLHSYAPEGDPDGSALQRVLGAAVPVCAGINLEYWFSRVDNGRFGAGTKLPHNVIGLHGLLEGTSGDLRTGLPLQTVEIHEPVRLLVVVHAPRDRVIGALAALPDVERLVRNAWVFLAAIDADGTWEWRDGTFHPATLGEPPPTTRSSTTWFRGRHDALGVARIAP
ncbi:MAG: DUF2309 family protein [Alphaproteobacteria bacterium]|nr:DUF2309 family protein [Alphaproteobacteria bacterium]